METFDPDIEFKPLLCRCYSCGAEFVINRAVINESPYIYCPYCRCSTSIDYNREDPGEIINYGS